MKTSTFFDLIVPNQKPEAFFIMKSLTFSLGNIKKYLILVCFCINSYFFWLGIYSSKLHCLWLILSIRNNIGLNIEKNLKHRLTTQAQVCWTALHIFVVVCTWLRLGLVKLSNRLSCISDFLSILCCIWLGNNLCQLN